MDFKNFRVRILIRILVLSAFIFLSMYSMSQSQWYVTSAVSLLIVVITIIELMFFIESVNRELSKFLLSIKNKDFSTTYSDSGKSKSSYFDLKRAFKEITHEFQNIQIEKELHYQYLQTVFAHSNTAIICFNKEGEVMLINEATKKLLGIHRIQKLSDLQKINQQLFEYINADHPINEQVIKFKLNNSFKHLNIQLSNFKLQNDTYLMVSLHDIKTALDEQELASWKKLIRVLNHEIMNSVTPISSLSNALNKMLKPEGKAIKLSELDSDDTDDLIESLQSIENRSKGLIKFVTNYKKITKLPQPTLSEIEIYGLLNHISLLLRTKLDESNILLEIYCDKHLKIDADHELIEQVIINLILNAIESFPNQEDKKIIISVARDKSTTNISIQDNGAGIPDEIFDQIFIPFYTTKKTGSGIGLSLSRQIMQLHKGNILAHTKLGEGSEFILQF